MTTRDEAGPANTGLRVRRGVPTGIALVVVALGISDVVTALLPERASSLRDLTKVVPLGIAHVASAATVVAGVLLVMLGMALRRRKRRAWRAAVVLVAITTASHVIRGLDIIPAAGSLAVLIALLALAREFHAAGDPRTRWRAPIALVAMILTSYLLGLLLLWVRGSHILGHPGFGAYLREVTYGLVGVTGGLRFTDDRLADLVYDVLTSFGAATVLLTAYLALRPPEPAATLNPEDEQRMRELVDAHGARDSLGFFALRRDKAAIFSPSGKAAVSYRVVSGVMLASGDPIGDPEAWPGAIAEFVAEANAHAWVPAVMGCSELGGEVWVREAGLHALEIGDEAIVEVAEFSLEGRQMRNVRQMVNRIERAGYVTAVRRVEDLTAAEVEDVRRSAIAWRGSDTERGFSMALGRFGDPADAGCVVVTAHHEGRLVALLQFVPWGQEGWSLDLMRRDHNADPGLNELMIVAAISAAPEFGIDRISLNFAAFRSALERGSKLGAGPVLRAWRGMLLMLSRWVQIESLYRFNMKFRPDWEPRFICYPHGGDIPRLATALFEVEGFVQTPTQWLALRRQRRKGLAPI